MVVEITELKVDSLAGLLFFVTFGDECIKAQAELSEYRFESASEVFVGVSREICLLGLPWWRSG